MCTKNILNTQREIMEKGPRSKKQKKNFKLQFSYLNMNYLLALWFSVTVAYHRPYILVQHL